jgi:hypothetical protein
MTALWVVTLMYGKNTIVDRKGHLKSFLPNVLLSQVCFEGSEGYRRI